MPLLGRLFGRSTLTELRKYYQLYYHDPNKKEHILANGDRRRFRRSLPLHHVMTTEQYRNRDPPRRTIGRTEGAIEKGESPRPGRGGGGEEDQTQLKAKATALGQAESGQTETIGGEGVGGGAAADVAAAEARAILPVLQGRQGNAARLFLLLLLLLEPPNN